MSNDLIKQAKEWLTANGNERALEVNGFVNSMAAFAEHIREQDRLRIEALERAALEYIRGHDMCRDSDCPTYSRFIALVAPVEVKG